MLFTSQILTKAAGSVGGLTFSHNRFGMYCRARVTPVNPSSEFQVEIRNFVATLANLWIDLLTDAQRSAWETYAANVAMVGKLGGQIFLTGLNHYIRSNVGVLQAGGTRVDDGPTIFNLGEYTVAEITASEAAQEISLAFTDTDAWVTEVGGLMMILDSRPQNPTRNYFKGPFRYADVVEGAVEAPASPQVHEPPYAFVEGQKLFCQIRTVRADGRLATETVINCLAAA